LWWPADASLTTFLRVVTCHVEYPIISRICGFPIPSHSQSSASWWSLVLPLWLWYCC
jgi:hypothetical protein